MQNYYDCIHYIKTKESNFSKQIMLSEQCSVLIFNELIN